MPDVWDIMWADLRSEELEEVGVSEVLGEDYNWRRFMQCNCGKKFIQICEEQLCCPECAKESKAWGFYALRHRKVIYKVGDYYFRACKKCGADTHWSRETCEFCERLKEDV